jgi:hypothetical protein
MTWIKLIILFLFLYFVGVPIFLTIVFCGTVYWKDLKKIYSLMFGGNNEKRFNSGRHEGNR